MFVYFLSTKKTIFINKNKSDNSVKNPAHPERSRSEFEAFSYSEGTVHPGDITKSNPAEGFKPPSPQWESNIDLNGNRVDYPPYISPDLLFNSPCLIVAVYLIITLLFLSLINHTLCIIIMYLLLYVITLKT